MKIVTLIGISAHSRLDERAAQEVIQNLQNVGSSNRVIIFLNTYGGQIEAGWKIALEILGRQADTVIIVPNRAKSTGTLISLAGTKVIARPQTEFGPVDPQVPVHREGQPVYLSALELLDSTREIERIQAQRAIRITKDYLKTVLEKRLKASGNVNALLSILLREDKELRERSHHLPFLPSYLNELGFNVVTDNLAKFCTLYSLYFSDPQRYLLERDTHLVEMSI